jgi:hypothetical protein
VNTLIFVLIGIGGLVIAGPIGAIVSVLIALVLYNPSHKEN